LVFEYPPIAGGVKCNRGIKEKNGSVHTYKYNKKYLLSICSMEFIDFKLKIPLILPRGFPRSSSKGG